MIIPLTMVKIGFDPAPIIIVIILCIIGCILGMSEYWATYCRTVVLGILSIVIHISHTAFLQPWASTEATHPKNNFAAAAKPFLQPWAGTEATKPQKQHSSQS